MQGPGFFAQRLVFCPDPPSGHRLPPDACLRFVRAADGSPGRQISASTPRRALGPGSLGWRQQSGDCGVGGSPREGMTPTIRTARNVNSVDVTPLPPLEGRFRLPWVEPPAETRRRRGSRVRTWVHAGGSKPRRAGAKVGAPCLRVSAPLRAILPEPIHATGDAVRRHGRTLSASLCRAARGDAETQRFEGEILSACGWFQAKARRRRG